MVYLQGSHEQFMQHVGYILLYTMILEEKYIATSEALVYRLNTFDQTNSGYLPVLHLLNHI